MENQVSDSEKSKFKEFQNLPQVCLNFFVVNSINQIFSAQPQIGLDNMHHSAGKTYSSI